MIRTGHASRWDSTQGQALLGVFGCAFVGSVTYAGGTPALLILLAIALLPARLLILGFVCFSYFRIHEAYPFLLPLKLPLVFSVASLAAIIIMFMKNLQEAPKERSTVFAVAALATFLAADVFFMIGKVTETNAPRMLIGLAMLLASIAFYVWYRALDSMNMPRWGIEMKLFMVLFIIVSLGVAFSQRPSEAVNYWLDVYWKIGAMTLVLAWLLRSRLDFQASIWMIVVSGALVSFVTFHNWYFGIDLVEGTRVSIARTLFSTPEQIENALPGHAIEGGSLLGDPNDLALVLLFPVGLALAAIARMGWSTWLGRFCCIVVPLLIIAIIMTQSRGGALGAVTAFAAIGLFYIRSKMLLAALALIGVIGLGIAMDLGVRSSGGLAEFNAEGIDRSALERLHAWTAAINMTAAHPITGVGLRNFASQFREYTPVWSGRNMAAHSTWFGVMAETGLPGIAVLVALIGALLLALRRTWQTLQRIDADPIYATFCLGLFASLLGFCAAGTFLSQGFGWPLYLLVGFTSALACTVHQLDSTALSMADKSVSTHAPAPQKYIQKQPAALAPQRTGAGPDN